MILPKLTRQRLYKAAGKAVEIVWPEDGPEPKVGRRYSVQTEAQKPGEAQLLVVSRTELSAGWKATVKLDADPVRLLGKTGGYVSSPRGAMAHTYRTDEGDVQVEPEAVDERYQRLLSEEGRQKTALLGATNRQRQKALSKEQEISEGRPKTKRSERAKLRHLRSIEERKAA